MNIARSILENMLYKTYHFFNYYYSYYYYYDFFRKSVSRKDFWKRNLVKEYKGATNQDSHTKAQYNLERVRS